MISSLLHFALGVPDLKAGEEFYTAFGLNMIEENDRLAFRCDNRLHDEVVLIETGQDRKFQYISFGSDLAGLDRIKKVLDDRGIEQLDPPFKEGPVGLWFRDPDNNLVNVQLAEQSLVAAESVLEINRPGVNLRIDQRGCPSSTLTARPRKLGHMILFTPHVAQQQRFYNEVLGMQLSDTIVDEYGAFMRVAGGSDHHVLGFLHSSAPGFHHASFEMGSIDEAEVSAMRIFQKGHRHAWGPGRHAIGSNYFHYFRDPWNGMAEYYFDIDYISNDREWQPVDWTKKEGMFLWAADGPPPKDFGTNYEAY